MVPTFDPIPIPPLIIDLHRKATLCADIFFVQGLPFLHTISHKLKFRTLLVMENQKRETIQKGIKMAIDMYHG